MIMVTDSEKCRENDTGYIPIRFKHILQFLFLLLNKHILQLLGCMLFWMIINVFSITFFFEISFG